MNRKCRLMATALALVMLCACSPSQVATTPPPELSPSPASFDLDAYKASVKTCSDEINEATIILYNMAKYENNYWQTLGELSDSMVGSAFDWIAENSEETEDSINATYDSIRAQYKEIVLVEVEGKEAEEIEAAFKGLYDSYVDMYDIVTSPSGSIGDFVDAINENVRNSKDCSDELSLFLGDESAE